MDRNREIIYHPKQNLIRTGLLSEDNQTFPVMRTVPPGNISRRRSGW